MFKKDLETIDTLRTDAINVLEPHVSGLVKLGRYAAQLRWMMGKFPIDVCRYMWDRCGEALSEGTYADVNVTPVNRLERTSHGTWHWVTIRRDQVFSGYNVSELKSRN